jgi:phosphatidylinositol alpha-mannosyltransferase
MRMPLPASPFYIRQLLKRERFDILHVQMPYSPFLAARIINAASADTAVVGTFHIVPLRRYVGVASRLLAAMTVRSLHRFDAVMSVSAAAQAFARTAFGIRSDIISNPIRLSDFQHAEPFTRRGTVLQVLFIGRLVERKGCLLLLQATRILQSDPSAPNFRVTICGRGPLSMELESFVRDNQLQDIVTFKGFVPEAEKPRYFASADIAVFPSNGGESFGIVVVEAMASGRAAVLAGDNVGYRSILGDCPGSVLFDAKDPHALAAALREFLDNPTMRQHIATWQARHARSFDVGLIGPRIMRLYASALQARRNVR